MTRFRQGIFSLSSLQPGDWVYWRQNGDRKQAAVICPDCRRPVYLSARIHTIDDKGNVLHSLVCPHALCKFHDYIVLEGWRR